MGKTKKTTLHPNELIQNQLFTKISPIPTQTKPEVQNVVFFYIFFIFFFSFFFNFFFKIIF
jgi:hypothetical protein